MQHPLTGLAQYTRATLNVISWNSESRWPNDKVKVIDPRGGYSLYEGYYICSAISTPFYRSLENLYSFDPYIWGRIRKMSYFDPYFLAKYGKMYCFDPPFSSFVAFRDKQCCRASLTKTQPTERPPPPPPPRDYFSALRWHSRVGEILTENTRWYRASYWPGDARSQLKASVMTTQWARASADMISIILAPSTGFPECSSLSIWEFKFF